MAKTIHSYRFPIRSSITIGQERGKKIRKASLNPIPAEYLRYCANVFELPQTPLILPLEDEPFVPEWERYVREASGRGAWNTLRDQFPQLRFPVAAGISASDAYRAATRRGMEVMTAEFLVLEHPEQLSFFLHPTAAGRIPVLVSGHRSDFITLVRALAHRNEPVMIPDSQGACMVAGFNNWNRIRQMGDDFHALQSQKALYQDRFIILSDGPYSGVPAHDMGMSNAEWRRLSLVIRLEHECAHYFTKRVLGAMRHHVLDEILADYMGITAAAGKFRADWFLRFFGLEKFPHYRRGARLENYLGSDFSREGAFILLQQSVCQAARILESIPFFEKERILVLLALATTNLAGIAGPHGRQLLCSAVDSLRPRVKRWKRRAAACGE